MRESERETLLGRRVCVCDVGLCLVEDDTIGLFFSFLDLDLVIYLVIMRLIKMSLRLF